MTQLAELLRLIRFGQSSTSVAYYSAAVDRAKEGLALALHARDEAMAEIRINEPARTVPAFLIKKQEGVAT